MRILLDQGLPRSAARLLCDRGIDAVHAGDVGLATATGEQILQHARAECRLVVTLDADFHALLAVSGCAAPSVIRIREEGLKGPGLASLIETVVATCRDELVDGAVATVRDGAVRVRRLPVRPRPGG